MNRRGAGIVFRKELLDSLRDRRTLISMVVVPVLVMPLLVLGIGGLSVAMVAKAKETPPKVMVLGGEESPKLMSRLREFRDVRIVAASPDYAKQIAEKRVQAAIEVPTDFDARLERGESTTVRLFLFEGEMRSLFAERTLEEFFHRLREVTISERLAARRVPESLIKPFSMQRQNVAPPRKVMGNLFGGILPYMIIILCLSGAMYPAIDLTAGEKERGTIETLLCSPVSRTDLVLGKFFMVLAASLGTALLTLASMGASFLLARRLAGSLVTEGGGKFPLSVDPSSALAVFVMVIPVAVMLSALQLAIATFARSFKEAQSYLTPLMLVVILPAMVSMAPGVDLNWLLALVPIVNTSLVSKEIMTGAYPWPYIGLTLASSLAYAGVTLAVAVKLFQREEVLFRA